MVDFSCALQYLKHGFGASREGWNGKGMYIFLFRPDSRPTIMVAPSERRPWAYPPVYEEFPPVVRTIAVSLEPHIVMFTADRKFVPWLASQPDILAEDWALVGK